MRSILMRLGRSIRSDRRRVRKAPDSDFIRIFRRQRQVVINLYPIPGIGAATEIPDRPDRDFQ